MSGEVVLFTLAMAALATAGSLPVALWVAWLLARKRWPGKIFVETLVAIPLVLPPVATGFALLLLFGRHGWLGAILQNTLGLDIVFTWRAVVMAMAVMSFPLVVRTARIGFENVDPQLEDAARSLGAGPGKVFWQITLPLARRAVLAGGILGFARALGEFGATVVFAGNIAERTTTIPLAIYGDIIVGDDSAALQFIAVSLLLALGAVALGEHLARPVPGARVV
ncbi:MAG TPA: molybdate ABC transporter permease subunit [Opitutales bacterium]|nr:molybdate ABC transporter permease subunit [Opitutales bacterium]